MEGDTFLRNSVSVLSRKYLDWLKLYGRQTTGVVLDVVLRGATSGIRGGLQLNFR